MRLFLRTLLALGMVVLALAGPVSAAPAGAAPADGVVGDGTPGSCTDDSFNTVLSSSSLMTFNCGGPATIVLTTPKLINVPRTIDGGGLITLTGNLTTRLITLGSSAVLSLNNIVLTQFNGGATDGGAINVTGSGRLILNNVEILQSQTDPNRRGGAIATTGPVTIKDSRLEGNSSGSGGAIYANGSEANVTLDHSTLASNTAVNSVDGEGGGVLLAGAYLYMTGGAMSFNSASDLGGAVSMSGNAALTIQAASDGPAQVFSNTAVEAGGAIFNVTGSITLQGADVEYNRALTTTANLALGGAIDDGGPLLITNSQLAHNQARSGGAVYIKTSLVAASAGITHTLFYSNTATDSGGGLYANVLSTTVTIVDSQFDSNYASQGGGLARVNAHLSLSKSSFTNNTAQYGGGLILKASPNPDTGGYVEIQDSTISSNHRLVGEDGGIDNGGLLDLRNVTLKDNAYGLYNEPGATIRLQSTVLDNLDVGPLNCNGTLPTTAGHNLSTDSTCNLSLGQNDQIGAPAQLGSLTTDPLVFTQFHLPLAGSPLINNGGPGCSPTDQRYALRLNACDIGAIVSGGLLPRIFVPLVRK